ncbi:ABC-2 type transport system permease protein [Allocatelliglobosispora scoriae]|uniref:ABC-2 type transport system permease protein n=1 Tax=Allocatelliglobosispora scoriae TaxID=643052 RepID=A0A841BHT5_9ACTN|nr:ABC transporter permease [Allocatelliglobosispora scoriae]MBB5866888.1 ABC-2 type transport system permease protein [Allocatelliglobosispora scoriae]
MMREVRQVMGSEWTKLWSVRSTWWCLAGTVALMVLSAFTLGGARATDMLNAAGPGTPFAATQPVISAAVFVQFTLITLAMLAITAEYAGGGIRTTLQATPVRGRLLAAKALVIVPVIFVAGIVSGAVAAGATYAVLSTELFGGYATLPPGRTAVDLARVGAFLALVGLFALGAGTALRSAAGTLTVVFLALVGFPMMLVMTGSEAALAVAMRLPLFAGLAFMGSDDALTGGPMPYPAAEGLGWLVGWAALAMGVGYAALRRRDA